MLRQMFHGFLQWVRRSNIRTRLIATFMVICLLPSLVLALFANRVYSNSITKKTSQVSHQTMQLLNHNLTQILDEYSRYLDELSVSEKIHQVLYNILYHPELPQNSRIESLLDRKNGSYLFYSDPTVLDVYIFDHKKELVTNNGYIGFDREQILPILDATDKTSPKSSVAAYSPPYGRQSIALCRKIYDDQFHHIHVGYLVLFINEKVLQDAAFPSSSLGEGTSMVLLNNLGSPIATQNPHDQLEADSLQTVFDQIDITGKPDGYTDQLPDPDNLTLYTYNRKYQITTVSFIPRSLLETEIRWVTGLVLVITLVLLCICLGLSLLIYHSIVSPIKAIVSVCAQPKVEDKLRFIGDPAPDELGYLARSVDDMNSRNQQMLRELALQDQQKRELEIEMLRLQINPHFLFNTLGTLKWMASINGVSTLSDGIGSLASLLRSTLVKKDEMVTLEEEIQGLQDYCTIQNLRYAGQFTVSYQVDQEANACKLPKLLLQPLVENAILHGSHADDILNISVTCRIIEDRLDILVTDDGAGFSVDAVFDRHKDRFTGIGLSNVDSRLRLYYGEQFRLQIQAHPGQGTSCHISIPAKKA